MVRTTGSLVATVGQQPLIGSTPPRPIVIRHGFDALDVDTLGHMSTAHGRPSIGTPAARLRYATKY